MDTFDQRKEVKLNWKERSRYQASWGKWYVQVDTDWGIVELRFDKEPDEKMLAVLAYKLQPPEPMPEPAEMVELTVDNAISFLTEKLITADAVEKSKITLFVMAKAVEVKPVEPIEVVK